MNKHLRICQNIKKPDEMHVTALNYLHLAKHVVYTLTTYLILHSTKQRGYGNAHEWKAGPRPRYLESFGIFRKSQDISNFFYPPLRLECKMKALKASRAKPKHTDSNSNLSGNPE